ncbi:MAG TPA: DUF1592 domain-containing protein [Polyangia bacterium]|jgi:hypothetical protein|nr:DUF1592 domain-containing protein [Polyangia bacterium]
MHAQQFPGRAVSGERRVTNHATFAVGLSLILAGFAGAMTAGCQGRIIGASPSTSGVQTPSGAGGSSSSPGGAGGATSSGAGGSTPSNTVCANGDAMPITVPIQRINDTQWNTVVGQLFGASVANAASAAAFPAPSTSYLYTTYSAGNPTGEGESQAILEAAEAVALQVVDTVPACSGDETACANSYLKNLATRAFRRAPTTDELALVTGAYTHARPSMSYAESVGVGVETILQMPQFLYLLEDQPSSTTAAPIALTGPQIAQRMALLYWNGLPDDALTQAATKGELANATNRLTQAQRMLNDPRAKPAMEGFLRQWLTLQGFADTLHAPDVNAALVEALARDIDDALDAPSGLTALITSSRTWVNSTLETFYGIPAKSTGPADWHTVDLDPNQRVGLLTNPLLMTRDAHGVDAQSPILRGKFVRLMLMCDSIPSPPANAQALQSTISAPGASIREQSQARLNSSGCGPCHTQMDPIGFGFSAFDGLGRYVPTVGGMPVDVSGNVVSSSELGGNFMGVRELGNKLAQSAKVQACLATQWMRYSFGETETGAMSCQIQSLANRFKQQGYSLKALFAQLTALDGFVMRSAAAEGN